MKYKVVLLNDIKEKGDCFPVVSAVFLNVFNYNILKIDQNQNFKYATTFAI